MKGWRTVLVNAAVGILGVVTPMVSSAPIDPQLAGYVVAALAAINVFLRAITTTAVGRSA